MYSMLQSFIVYPYFSVGIAEALIQDSTFPLILCGPLCLSCLCLKPEAITNSSELCMWHPVLYCSTPTDFRTATNMPDLTLNFTA